MADPAPLPSVNPSSSQPNPIRPTLSPSPAPNPEETPTQNLSDTLWAVSQLPSASPSIAAPLALVVGASGTVQATDARTASSVIPPIADPSDGLFFGSQPEPSQVSEDDGPGDDVASSAVGGHPQASSGSVAGEPVPVPTPAPAPVIASPAVNVDDDRPTGSDRIDPGPSVTVPLVNHAMTSSKAPGPSRSEGDQDRLDSGPTPRPSPSGESEEGVASSRSTSVKQNRLEDVHLTPDSTASLSAPTFISASEAVPTPSRSRSTIVVTESLTSSLAPDAVGSSSLLLKPSLAASTPNDRLNPDASLSGSGGASPPVSGIIALDTSDPAQSQPTNTPLASLDPSALVPSGLAASDIESTTYVSAGTTLRGSAAIAALAAAATGSDAAQVEGGAEVTKHGGSSLSSFAIVGIVGGILVFFIIVYVVWYQWRKKRRESAEEAKDRDGTTGEDAIADSRSSFGNDPFEDEMTGAGWYDEEDEHERRHKRGSRRSGRRDRYDEDEYDQDDQDNYTEYNRQTQYTLDDRYAHDQGDDGEYLQDEKTGYDLATYGDGLTAAMMEDDRETIYGSGQSPYTSHPPQAEKPITAITAHPTAALVDPFKPPAPVSRSISSFSDPFALAPLDPPSLPAMPAAASHASRPGTTASHASYGSIYAGYANPSAGPSRRGTAFEHDQEELYDDDDAYEGYATSVHDPKTPATSALMWANAKPDRREPAPPVPAMPAASRPERDDQGRHQAVQASVPAAPRRPAPAAVMAQTPMMNQQAGWQGVIPGFR